MSVKAVSNHYRIKMDLRRIINKTVAIVALSLQLLTSSVATAEETVKFGYNQWIGSAALFIAIDQKFFKKHGLNMEFTEFAGPGDGIAAVIAGQLDGTATTSDNIIIIADKAGTDKITQVYFSDTSFGGDAIIAKKGIDSITDLKGKTVAASIGQVSHLLLIKALDSVGMKDTDVKMVNMDGEAAGAAYAAGRLDAAVTWEPYLSQGKKSGGKIVYSSADAPNLILDTIAFNTAFAKSKPGVVPAFLAAIKDGEEMLDKEPAKSHAILAKFLSVDVKDIKEMLGGVKLYSAEMNKKLFASGELVKASAEVKSFLLGRGVIKQDFDMAPLFDGSYIK